LLLFFRKEGLFSLWCCAAPVAMIGTKNALE